MKPLNRNAKRSWIRAGHAFCHRDAALKQARTATGRNGREFMILTARSMHRIGMAHMEMARSFQELNEDNHDAV